MIIGNIEAAKKLMQFSKDNALIIHHPPPTALSIKYFKEFFEDIKIQFTFDNVLGLQEDLLKVSHKEDIPEEIKQLCFFKSRRMQETAGYKLFKQIMKEQKQIHFALGLQHYTHFTSPMRRMADIIVHEALNKIVMKEEPLKIDEEEI